MSLPGGVSVAAANSHRIMITFPEVLPGDGPAAEDTTSGKVWLYTRDDEPVAVGAGAVVAGPNGSVSLGADALVHEWSDVAVNTTLVVGTQTVGSYVTPELFANAGELTLPLDHLVVNGLDGTFYVWEIVYTTATSGRTRSIIGRGQLDAATDYLAASATGPAIDGADPVLSDALNDLTLSSATLQSMIGAANTLGGYPVGSFVLKDPPDDVSGERLRLDTPGDLAETSTSTTRKRVNVAMSGVTAQFDGMIEWTGRYSPTTSVHGTFRLLFGLLYNGTIIDREDIVAQHSGTDVSFTYGSYVDSGGVPTVWVECPEGKRAGVLHGIRGARLPASLQPGVTVTVTDVGVEV